MALPTLARAEHLAIKDHLRILDGLHSVGNAQLREGITPTAIRKKLYAIRYRLSNRSSDRCIRSMILCRYLNEVISALREATLNVRLVSQAVLDNEGGAGRLASVS